MRMKQRVCAETGVDLRCGHLVCRVLADGSLDENLRLFVSPAIYSRVTSQASDEFQGKVYAISRFPDPDSLRPDNVLYLSPVAMEKAMPWVKGMLDSNYLQLVTYLSKQDRVIH